MTDIPGVVSRVKDGDTFVVEVTVRLADVNARELSEPGGMEAADHLARTILQRRVVLHDVAPDFYARRVDARVEVLPSRAAPGIRDLGASLVAEGWLATYPGHGPKVNPPWPRGT